MRTLPLLLLIVEVPNFYGRRMLFVARLHIKIIPSLLATNATNQENPTDNNEKCLMIPQKFGKSTTKYNFTKPFYCFVFYGGKSFMTVLIDNTDDESTITHITQITNITRTLEYAKNWRFRT